MHTMYKTIKYPYKLLTKLELERLNQYKERHNFNDDEIYVRYTTDESLGVGYDIIVTHQKPYKKDGRWHYGFYAENITDMDNMLKTI